MKSRTFVLHSLIISVLLSCTAGELNDDFLIARVDYSSGMLGTSAEVTITQQGHPFVSIPAYTPVSRPMDVVFRDEAGEVVTRKAMTVVDYEDQGVLIDAPLLIRWVTWVENDARFDCVGVELGSEKMTPLDGIRGEDLPIPLCQ